MILDAADGEGLHPVVAGDAAEVGPEAILEISVDRAATLFGAEDVVVERTAIGVGHARAPAREKNIVEAERANSSQRDDR